MKIQVLLLMVPFFALVACDTGGRGEQPAETPEADAPATGGSAGEAGRDAPTAPARPGRPGSQQDAAEAATAQARVEPTEGNEARGLVRFSEGEGSVTITGTISGLTPGAHGLHVHEHGDCGAPDASSAGGHFNPHDNPHGSPRDLPDERHVGDLGNITADADGEAQVSLDSRGMQLGGPDSVVGRALVVHADQDDFETQPSGDSGARVGCGVIRAAR